MIFVTYQEKGSTLYYSVERGDFGAKGDATEFKKMRDAKMVKLGLHEEQAISLLRLGVLLEK